MSKPSVKKNPDGTWSIVGVQERNLTQMQADYEELVKASQLIPGEQGAVARNLIVNNPELSGGMLASLSSYGAVPDNQLVKTLAEIDMQTRNQRQLDAFKEAQRIANEKFNKTPRGRLWTALKGFSRGATALFETPVELLGGAARQLKQSIDSWQRGEIDFWTGNPKDPTKTRADLGLPTGLLQGMQGEDVDSPAKLLEQTKIGQIAKQLRDEGRIDLGSGFFPSEETGAGFAARQAKLETSKVAIKVDGDVYYRPWSIFDPVTEVITFGNSETGYGSIISAIGELLISFKLDPVLAYSKISRAAKEADRVARLSEGKAAAKAYTLKIAKDAELEEASIRTQQALNELETAFGPDVLASRKAFEDAMANQLRVADEYDNMSWSPEKVAGFLSGSAAAPAIDALADISDWKQIWRLGKERGGRGGFTVEQSKAIAAAGTREEVLAALAPAIAKGEVVADVLDKGTATGRAVKGLINSKIVPGQAVTMANTVKGLAARAVRRVPYVEKIQKSLATGYSTIVPRGKAIHAADKDALIDAIYSYGRISKVSEAVLDNLADIVALTDDASEAGYTASARLFDEIYKANINNPGISPELLEEVTRIFRNGNEHMGNYWAARHGAGAKLDYILTNGKKVTISGPHLDSEFLNSMVYFPDARELLNTISFVNKLSFAGKSPEKIKEALDVATNVIWKRIVLVRPAYILRNIAEEQIRVLGTGHISFFNNPLMAMGMWLGRDGGPKWRQLINKFDPFRHTVMGDNFKLSSAAEEFAAETLAHDQLDSYIGFMSTRSVSGFDDDVRAAVKFAGFNPRKFGHPRWWEGLANEIRILHASPIGRVVAATGPTPDNQLATVDYFLRGAGKADWTQFAKQQKPDVRDFLLTQEGAMSYLFSGVDDTGRATSLAARIEEATGRGGVASQAIKNLIAYGKLETPGLSIAVPRGTQSAENSIRNAKEMASGRKAIKDANQEFADVLRKNFDGQGNWDDLEMSIPDVRYTSGKEKAGLAAEVSEWFFQKATKLESVTTMGPEWRQKYWDAIYDISAGLDEEAVARLGSVARDSLTPLKSWKGQPIGKKHPVWKAFESTKPGGNITLKEAHEYASMVASKHVAELFYDASRKRLLFHQLRLLFPFGQAWEDTIRRWGEIALDNPAQVYKIQKGLQWLTKPESSALYQLTDAKDYYDPNQGFFFTDPLDGQRKFFIPFMGTGLNFLSNLVTGKPGNVAGPYAISATPQSLNFAFASGSLMPGVGPGMQISLKLLDNLGVNPINIAPIGMRDMINKFIFPFGEPDLKSGILEGFLPGNWRRILAGAGIQEDAYAAAFAPVMNYLASGGNYNLDDYEDQVQLIRDTNRFSQWFTMFRGFFGLVSPFPLQPQGISTLDDGNTILSTALYNDFKELELKAGGNPNQAYADFMDLYGPEAIFAIINTSAGAPTNLMTYELIKRNPEVIDQYPDVYGYAYPNGGFSSELYRWQVRAGKKEKFTSKELIERATTLRYYAALDRLQSRLIGGAISEDQYEEASVALRDTFIAAGMSVKFDVFASKRNMEQLRRMAADAQFDDSDAVQGLRDYLYLRDAALQAAGITNDSLAKKGALPQREWLAGKAKEILERNPEFYKFYYRFFKKELEG